MPQGRDTHQVRWVSESVKKKKPPLEQQERGGTPAGPGFQMVLKPACQRGGPKEGNL